MGKHPPDLSTRVLSLARKLHPYQVKIRRHLHQRPELSNHEFETTRFLTDELARFNVRPWKLKLPTGIIAEVKGTKQGPPGQTIAIRTDIDALPILEKNKIPFVSKSPGKMHACGHDVHMATVLGTARLMSELKNEFCGVVRFLFQPSEEVPPGGARPLIEAGALENPRVKMIFGLHVDPRVAVGKIGLRDGPTMASVTDLDIIIRGKAGHAARPHQSVDAITAAAELIGSVQKMISRETDPMNPIVLTFGTINGGSARNVIADTVTMRATLRTLSAAEAKAAVKSIKRCVAGICKARGAKYELDIIAEYPPLVNEPEVNRLFADTYTDLFGKRQLELTEQVMGGEDFACYLQHVPGAMFRLGVRNAKIGATEMWHSDKFMVDEEGIYYGTALLARSALVALAEQ